MNLIGIYVIRMITFWRLVLMGNKGGGVSHRTFLLFVISSWRVFPNLNSFGICVINLIGFHLKPNMTRFEVTWPRLVIYQSAGIIGCSTETIDFKICTEIPVHGKNSHKISDQYRHFWRLYDVIGFWRHVKICHMSENMVPLLQMR